MSRENVELVHRAFDAFNRRDWDAFLGLMDPDVEALAFLAAMEAPITATMESAVGGRTCSTASLTSASRPTKFATVKT